MKSLTIPNLKEQKHPAYLEANTAPNKLHKQSALINQLFSWFRMNGWL